MPHFSDSILSCLCVGLIDFQTSEMKKQDIEESATHDSENATRSITKMESSAAVKDGPDKSPEASESQRPQTDMQSQSDEAVSKGKNQNFYSTISRGFFCYQHSVNTCNTLACKIKLSIAVHM